jgi:ribA/ribD-fused uncharacterized protein
MDEYLQNLEIFYDQKMKYLSKKEKFIRCNECDDKKEFKEEENKLILSCGSDKGECGPQIIIKLPKYIHYETKLDELRESIENEYNWEALQNYLEVSGEVKESKENKKKITEEISRIEGLFFKKNMEMKQKQLQSFYDQRIRKTKKCKEIGKELKKEGLTEEQKKELRQEYIRNVQEMNTEYSDIKELMDDINPFLTEEEHEVTIKHENYEYTKETGVPTRSGSKTTLMSRYGILYIMYEINELNSVLLSKIYKQNELLYKITGGLFGSSNYKEQMRTRLSEMTKQGYISRISDGVFKIEDKGKRFLDDVKQKELKDNPEKFEIGSRVSWIYNEKKKYGTIKEIKGLGAWVEDEKGKRIKKRFAKLMIEGEEDVDDIEIDSDEEEEEEEVITYFSRSKDNKWLSTFNRGEPFNYDGLLYPTVEHAFHAQKVDDEKKEEYQELFTNDKIDPSEAKKMGGKKNFELNEFSLRKDWDNVKLEKMKEITMEYYAANPELVEKLRKTGSKKLLHTGFRIDDYWGIKKNGEGENNHGKILMKIRDTL